MDFQGMDYALDHDHGAIVNRIADWLVPVVIAAVALYYIFG